MVPSGGERVRHPRAPSETRWKRPRRTGGAVRPIRAESPSLADVPRAVPPTEEVSRSTAANYILEILQVREGSRKDLGRISNCGSYATKNLEIFRR
jgi:hypothetical protein